MAGGPGEQINRHFIISAKSQKLIVRTGQPPEPPSNLGVLASTCHSLQIGWDPPRERGVEVKCKLQLACSVVNSNFTELRMTSDHVEKIHFPPTPILHFPK